ITKTIGFSGFTLYLLLSFGSVTQKVLFRPLLATAQSRGLLHLAQVRRFGSEPTQTSISTHDNTAEWLVEFMSNRSRKFAHGRYPCYSNDFGLRPDQTILRRLPLGDF